MYDHRIRLPGRDGLIFLITDIFFMFSFYILLWSCESELDLIINSGAKIFYSIYIKLWRYD